MEALMHLITAFGLSGAAGLNAFIPLLAVSVLSRLGVVHLAAPYDFLGSTAAIAIISVLLVIELVIDKVPGADHANDVVQTFVRPTAGAILFAAQTGVVDGIPSAVFLVLGLVMALSVHGTKTATRPVVNATTLGVGAPVISALEDGVSLVATMLAIFVPILFLLFAVAVVYLAVRLWRGRAKLRKPEAAPKS